MVLQLLPALPSASFSLLLTPATFLTMPVPLFGNLNFVKSHKVNRLCSFAKTRIKKEVTVTVAESDIYHSILLGVTSNIDDLPGSGFFFSREDIEDKQFCYYSEKHSFNVNKEGVIVICKEI